MSRPALLGLILLGLLLPAIASAHGGSVVAAGGNEAYRLTVQAADTRAEDGSRAVDLTAYPVRLSNGVTDLKADVRIIIDGGEELRPQPLGDGLETLVPVERAGEWRGWTVRATVAGTGGSLTVVGTPEQTEEPSGPPVAVLAGSLVVVALLGGGAVAVRRRRDAAADDT